MKLTEFIFILLFFIIFDGAQNPLPAQLSNEQPVEIQALFPRWTFWLPGGTHFYKGDISKGVIFSGLETGLIVSGIILDDELQMHSSSPYYNYPLYLGMNLYAVDKIDFAKNQLDFIKSKNPDFAYDPASFNDLLKEPFRLRNIFTPITGGFVALALLELYIESQQAEFSIKRVDRIRFLDKYIQKNEALPVYTMTSLGMSWEAGVGEEYWMRNFLMPILDYRMGENKGLLLTSGIFGSMHAFNYLFVDDPDPLAILYHVSFASLTGYILGRNVQHNNYKIGKAVAAHTWYDFSLMLGSFLVNPKENFFGVDIKIKI